ncbi:AraC family transcriptional regulator [Neobacillus pocheonensis]|uniref:AraC family transcriptional regulator n=1 Tax=Neobacillus pocheonensis TaxID=363869 RepID=A0ABT0WB64_9BACI|nr:AraC family transcriptional regulator [Neobacillus pocheonensis]
MLHQHEYTEILFIQDGQGNFTLNGKIVNVNRGDLLLINSNIEHETASSIGSRFKGFSLSVSALHLSGLPKGYIIADNESPILSAQGNHITINKYIEDIYEEYTNSDLGSQEIISSLLTTLIIKILRTLYSTKSGANASISEKVKKYITENYNRDISLNELANVVYVNPYHLAHTFKNEVGISPIQFLITHRIEVAKTMLLHSDLTIREIASKVGYPNANYFNLLFKKFTGYSPGKFRKNF